MFKKISITGWKFFLSGHGISIRTGKYFGLAAVTGAFVGITTVAFALMINWAQTHILEALSTHRILCVFLPAIGAILGCLLIRRFARVEHARGTDSAIRAFHKGELISRAVIPVKSVASVLTVGCGGSGGYEGPVTLIGAACGSVVTKMLHLNARAARILMAAGLAAGIAALFRAPLAGAIFGAEIFYSSSDLEYDAILPSFCASAVSYTVFACFFGWGALFTMPECVYTNGLRLIPYFFLAFVIAYGARFYITFFRATENWFRKRTWPDWVKVAVGGLGTGLIGFFMPSVLGTGYPMIQSSFEIGESGALINGGALTIIGFLMFFFLKVVATSFTVASGGSAGVFAPAIVCGGALGAAIGLFFRATFPAFVGIHPAAFALVGMAGFLAAAVRVPITAIVMVAEISGNHDLLLPTMWVCGIAFWLNNGWSLYRSQVHDRESSPVHA